MLESFDVAQGWSLIAGTATLSVAGIDKRQGAGSLQLDNGQNTTESIAENGNILSQPWRVQLVSARGYYERTFPRTTVEGALCTSEKDYFDRPGFDAFRTT